jgi:hypothetical protein
VRARVSPRLAAESYALTVTPKTMSANADGERHATEILSAAQAILSARTGSDVRLRARVSFPNTPLGNCPA